MSVECAWCESWRLAGYNYCANCARNLQEPANALLWAKGNNDFAIRVEVGDVEGFLRKELIVEPGQRALVFTDGHYRGEVSSGSVDMGGLLRRIMVLGRPEKVVAIVVSSADTALAFSVPDAETADGMMVTAEGELVVMIGDAAKFAANVMGSRRQFTVLDLRRDVYPQLRQALQAAARAVPFDDLAARQEDMEREVLSALAPIMERMGLRIVRFSLLAMIHGQLDALRRRKEQIDIEARARDIDLDATDTRYAQDRRAEAQATREYGARLTEWEDRYQMWQRMADSLTAERMRTIRREQDFLDFWAEVDKHKMLREQDVREVARQIVEEEQDHEMARRHLLERIQLERAHELQQLLLTQEIAEDASRRRLAEQQLRNQLDLLGIETSGQQALDLQHVDHELEKRRRILQDRAAWEERLWEQRRRHAKVEFADALEQERAAFDEGARQETIEHEQDVTELTSLIDLQQRKRAGDREHRGALIEQDLGAERERMGIAQDAEDRVAQRELARLEAFGKLGTEALIAAADADKASMIADLAKTEALKGMTEEQILALAAEKSSAVAEAFAEKYRAAAAVQGADVLGKQLERVLAEQKEGAQLREEQAAEFRQTMERMFNKALDTQRDVAVAATEAGKGQQQMAVVQPQGQVLPVFPAAAPAAICPACNLRLSSGAIACPSCGHRL
jgi:hypothetical protein